MRTQQKEKEGRLPRGGGEARAEFCRRDVGFVGDQAEVLQEEKGWSEGTTCAKSQRQNRAT